MSKIIKKLSITSLLLALGLAFGVPNVSAEASSGKSTRKEKQERASLLKKFSLTEDPGTDPDPERVFMRGDKPYTIIKIPKVDALPPRSGEKGWIRHIYVKTYDLEVYQESEDAYWVFLEKKERHVSRVRFQTNDRGNRVQIREYPSETIEEFKAFRKEFAEVVPAPSDSILVFEESSKGLPNRGSWRNSPDTADMNGDGFLDIIAPPQRGAPNTPSIYLGDGTGGWKQWTAVSFPFAIDYGSVSVGDLNGDGHLDLALAVHLRGPVVWLGDGAGAFVDSSEGLPANYPTRRLRLGDVDNDGDLDLVISSEGPTRGGSDATTFSKLKVFVNDGTAKWAGVDVNEPNRTVGGDWLRLANLNGDEYPDIIGSSIYYGARETIHLSRGPAQWEPFGWNFLPIDSYYVGIATGRFTDRDRDDAIVGFQRYWRYDVDPDLVPPPPAGRLQGIERVTWDSDGKAVRTPVIQWLNASQELKAMDAGDFDGDGNLDVAFVDSEELELKVLLGDGKGAFTMARVEGVSLPDNETYDLHVADLNGDGRDDLVLLFEATETRKTGSIRVYLSRGAK